MGAVRDLFLRMGRPDLADRTFRIKRVAYDYITLAEFMNRLQPRLGLLSGINTGGIEDHAGRILVGVDDEGAKAAVLTETSRLGIPDDAVNVQVFGPTQDVMGLRDIHSTMRGGLAVSRLPSDSSWCSAGVRWMAEG
jgi:hypothetical protein